MNASPFRKLPGETRNQIYELVFTTAHRVSVFLDDSNPKPTRRAILNTATALSRVCKEINTETKDLARDARAAIANCKFSVHNCVFGAPWAVNYVSATVREESKDEAETYMRDWYKRFKTWYDEVTANGILNIYEVELVFDTWKMSYASGKDDPHSTTMTLISLLYRNPHLSLGMRPTDTKITMCFHVHFSGSWRLQYFSIPTGDRRESKRIFRDVTEQPRAALRHAHINKEMTLHEFAECQSRLGRCRRKLESVV